MDLRGRRALITGALGGLGRIFAKTLAELGADLILVDHPNGNFNSLVAELSEWEIEINCIYCDIEKDGERYQLIEKIKNDGRSLSILINNAAFVGSSNLNGWSVPFEQQTLDSWRRAFEVNLTSVFDFCQGLTSVLKSSPGASIINISSIYGIVGPDWSIYEGTEMSNPAAYAASKGGLIQLTRWLSTTLAPSVKVNAISPGGIIRNQPQKFIDRYQSRTPMKRMANELDFAGVIAFLASDLSEYMTGQNLIVDGGWSSW